MALGFIILVINLAWSTLRGKPAGDDPFGLGEEDDDNESSDSSEHAEQKESTLESPG